MCFSLLLPVCVRWSVLFAFFLPVAVLSCLGQTPLDDVDRQSSSSGVTWMPTSTGVDAFLSSLCVGDGGLSPALSRQRLPLHCFLLCSIKIRMSPSGKFIWHWPQVRRSWSPSGAAKVPCASSSSVRMASRESATVEEHKESKKIMKICDSSQQIESTSTPPPLYFPCSNRLGWHE